MHCLVTKSGSMSGMQAPGTAAPSQPAASSGPTPAAQPQPPSGDQDMGEVDDEPAPPADLEISQPASAPPGDADTAMDEEPAPPMDVPIASSDTAAAMETEAGGTSGLGAQLVQAAQAAGIDMAFLEALPEDLRAEVSISSADVAWPTAAAIITSSADEINIGPS